tara:strand:+ start:4129 stop:4461 length:333 start_codon:yes stop_codon:yes gene_type:complete
MIFLQAESITELSKEYFGVWSIVILLCFSAITYLILELKRERKKQDLLIDDIKKLQNSKDELTKDCLNALNAYSSAIEKQTIIESNAKESLAKTIEAFRKAVEENKCKVQ